jgi:hypothetical protein
MSEKRFDSPPGAAIIALFPRHRSNYLRGMYDGHRPYRRAHFVDVPFTPLRELLAASRLVLISTAAPSQPGITTCGDHHNRENRHATQIRL